MSQGRQCYIRLEQPVVVQSSQIRIHNRTLTVNVTNLDGVEAHLDVNEDVIVKGANAWFLAALDFINIKFEVEYSRRALQFIIM